MKNTIYCKTTAKGISTFYLKTENGEYFLFNQNYRRGVNDYYKNGVSLDNATDYTKSKFDASIIRTMSKIFMYVKYVEKEYDVEILKQTIKKNKKYKNNNSRICA